MFAGLRFVGNLFASEAPEASKPSSTLLRGNATSSLLKAISPKARRRRARVEERVRGGIKFVNQSNHELVYEVPAEQVRARIKYLNLSNHELVYDADLSPDSSLSEEDVEGAEGAEGTGLGGGGERLLESEGRAGARAQATDVAPRQTRLIDVPWTPESQPRVDQPGVS